MPLWAKKMDSKLAKTGPNPIASIGGPKMPGQWEAQLFQLLPTYIYIGEGIFATKKMPWYPFSARHGFSLLLILLASAFRRKLWFKIVSFNSRFDGQLFWSQDTSTMSDPLELTLRTFFFRNHPSNEPWLGVKKSGTCPQPHPPTDHPPKSWYMTLDPKCYTFLESSHQMQFISAEKRFFFQHRKNFFFRFTK